MSTPPVRLHTRNGPHTQPMSELTLPRCSSLCIGMNSKKTADFVKREWNENVIPSLMDFIRIPNVSPSFDGEWDTNGLQMQAFELVTRWAKAQKLATASSGKSDRTRGGDERTWKTTLPPAKFIVRC